MIRFFSSEIHFHFFFSIQLQLSGESARRTCALCATTVALSCRDAEKGRKRMALRSFSSKLIELRLEILSSYERK